MREYDDPEIPISLDMDDVRDFIKNNLSVGVFYDYGELPVSLYLYGERIDRCSCSLPTPNPYA